MPRADVGAINLELNACNTAGLHTKSRAVVGRRIGGDSDGARYSHPGTRRNDRNRRSTRCRLAVARDCASRIEESQRHNQHPCSASDHICQSRQQAARDHDQSPRCRVNVLVQYPRIRYRLAERLVTGPGSSFGSVTRNCPRPVRLNASGRVLRGCRDDCLFWEKHETKAATMDAMTFWAAFLK